MDFQAWLALTVAIATILTLMFTKVRTYIVMMGGLTILSVMGVLTTAEALNGFSNSGLITIAALFIVAAGMYSSGAIDMVTTHLLGHPNSVREAIIRIIKPVFVLSGFLNNTPVVATMIPAIHAWSRRIDIAPSKLMIPLSYASIFGGTLTMIGTSTNLIINGQYQDLTGSDGFGLFDITLIGLPVAIVCIFFMWAVFPRLLPNYKDDKAFSNIREFTLEVSVAMDGPLVGKTIEQAGLRNLQKIYLIEIERTGTVLTAVSSDEKLLGGDRLVFAGNTDAISDLLRINGIVPSPSEEEDAVMTPHQGRHLVEAVVSPHCGVIGSAIRDTRFRDRYGAAILAVARQGQRLKSNLGGIKLRAGDTLLLEARSDFVNRQKFSKEFLLIHDLNTEPPRHDKAMYAWMILGALVFLAATGITSMLNASLLAAGLMIITGACSISQAEKNLDLNVIVTIGASFALGLALEKTGVAGILAEQIVGLSAGNAILLLILCYVAVSILTEMITNNAAAVIMLPIVLNITQQAGLNEVPFVFAIMMAASASFATPLGYQTNLMVYGPGDYRFTDFLKVGIPMNIIAGSVTIGILVLFWDLTL